MLSALFNGRPDKNLVDTGGFQHSDEHLEEFLGQLPSLSEESKTKVVKELTYNVGHRKQETNTRKKLIS